MDHVTNERFIAFNIKVWVLKGQFSGFISSITSEEVLEIEPYKRYQHSLCCICEAYGQKKESHSPCLKKLFRQYWKSKYE